VFLFVAFFFTQRLFSSISAGTRPDAQPWTRHLEEIGVAARYERFEAIDGRGLRFRVSDQP